MSDASPVEIHGPPARLEPKHRVLLVCVIGTAVTAFDSSAVLIALPAIAADMASDLRSAQWVVLASNLALAALLVPMGHLSDTIGRARIYVAGVLLFSLGALWASLSPAMAGVIAARVLVGAGSGMVQGTAMAMLVGDFAPRERATVLGTQLGVIGLGAIAGPALGGMIVERAGWRALFGITAVAMMLVLAAGQRTLRARVQESRSPRPVGELYSMLDIGRFRTALFALGSLAAFVTFMGISGVRFLTPFFLQRVQGLSPETAGLIDLPSAITVSIVAPFAGRVADRYGAALCANVGMAVAIAGFAMFATIESATPPWMIATGLVIMSLGVSIFAAANSSSVLGAVTPDSYGLASGFVTLCRQSGGVIGVMLATSIVTMTMDAGGYPNGLSAIEGGVGDGVLIAFTRGVRFASLALAMLGLLVLVIYFNAACLLRANREKRLDSAWDT